MIKMINETTTYTVIVTGNKDIKELTTAVKNASLSNMYEVVVYQGENPTIVKAHIVDIFHDKSTAKAMESRLIKIVDSIASP